MLFITAVTLLYFFSGTVPGPILFGAIIDDTCILWREKCGKQASCWIYNNEKLSFNFFIFVSSFKVVSIVFFILAHQLYKPPAEKTVKFVVSNLHSDSMTSGVTIVTDGDTGSWKKLYLYVQAQMISERNRFWCRFTKPGIDIKNDLEPNAWCSW